MTETRHILHGGNDNPNVDLTEIFKSLDETENAPWELENEQPIQTPTLTPKQLLITLSVPVSLFLTLLTLITH